MLASLSWKQSYSVAGVILGFYFACTLVSPPLEIHFFLVELVILLIERAFHSSEVVALALPSQMPAVALGYVQLPLDAAKVADV